MFVFEDTKNLFKILLKIGPQSRRLVSDVIIFQTFRLCVHYIRKLQSIHSLARKKKNRFHTVTLFNSQTVISHKPTMETQISLLLTADFQKQMTTCTSTKKDFQQIIFSSNSCKVKSKGAVKRLKQHFTDKKKKHMHASFK